jgi:uncharacterized iron-regulated membrane protein
MHSLFAITLAASAVVAPTVAQQADQADQAPPPSRPTRGGGMMGALMRADTNADGIITREEAIASSDAMFDRLDTDRDGIVSPEEIQAARGAMRRGGTTPRGEVPPPAPRAGATAAGLTRQQWHDRALRQFDRLDGNHDGKVDRTEIANYQQLMRERRMERQGGGDMPPPPAPSSQQ